MRLRAWLVGWVFVSFGVGCQNGSSLSNVGTTHLELGESQSIVGGDAVEEAEPIARSTVAFYYNPPQSDHVMNFCTGTIVSSELILTAAHCLADVANELKISLDDLKSRVLVGFGTQIVTQKTDPRVQFLSIRSFAIHQNYKVDSFQNATKEPMYDIALVRLSNKIPTGYRAARLAKDKAYIKEGSQLTLAGYGIVNGVTQEEAKQLMKVDVHVAVPKVTEVQFAYRVQDGKSSCSGDSGGPAYARNNTGQLVVVGVTSWGDQFCRKFGVYTSVPALIGWVMDTFKSL
jgi:secreted trypsin-like serine protease